jgi:trehalose-phosphatase
MNGADEILERFRVEPERAAFLCDVDGTLAPIEEDPEAARVPDEARAALRALVGRYRLVACVSGRRASIARAIVGIDEIAYAGNHGLELLGPGEATPRLAPALGPQGGTAAGFTSRLDRRRLEAVGLRLEDKGPIQAIHWRGASDPRLAGQRARELAELAGDQGLEARFGRMVVELRPRVPIDKGSATRELVTDSGADRALFGGDDRTDLDAFAALRELHRGGRLDLAVCVGVSSSEAPDEIARDADLVVDGTDGFLELMRAL